jgi:hypothetical protein
MSQNPEEVGFSYASPNLSQAANQQFKLPGVQVAAVVTYGLGWLMLVGGPIAGLILANREVEESNWSSFFQYSFTTSSKPFVGLGIAIAVSNILFGAFFIAVGGFIAHRSE